MQETQSTKSSATAFKKLDASEEALVNETSGVTELESVCMNCYEQGRTKLLLTRIPFYRDVIISSFNCENCHFINNGIESANKIQDRGVRYKLTVRDSKDMNRELVKSDNALFQIPVLDFEIPVKTQKGYLTTIEGILDRVISNVKADIEARKDVDPETTDKMRAFLIRVIDLKELKSGSFDIILDDASGDSFIENPYAPSKDQNMTVVHYRRTKADNELLGLDDDEERRQNEEAENVDLRNEVVKFHNNCPNCNAICDTNMKLTDIPYFKTVIIMATNCENCGIRSSEVKSGSGIEEKGVKYTLKITDPSDLNRDLLKSDNASFEIPEIDFCMGEGTLGGKFTTIEGLLKDCIAQLNELDIFGGGDSDSVSKVGNMKKCIERLDLIQSGQMLNVTVILDDPSGNSYLQNVYAPEDDPNLTVKYYERSYEQNELLGLNDMKTENYQSNETE